MTGQQLRLMKAELRVDEGVRLEPYTDTVGKVTVLCGYNVTDRGWEPLEYILGRPIDPVQPRFTAEDVERQLDHDIQHFEQRVLAREPLYKKLDGVRQRAFVNLTFNMGARLFGFKAAIGAARLALKQTDPALVDACWTACAFHMMDSLWARQVDDGLGGLRGRADRVCHMLRTGQAFHTP